MSVSLTGGVRHPKIYAYTIDQFSDTPWNGSREGTGLIKIGDTQRDVAVRIREQLHAIKMPVATPYRLFLAESAVTKDGRVFRDHEIHKELTRAGVRQVEGEWYECTPDEVHAAINAVRNGSSLTSLVTKNTFGMRPEQVDAVEITAKYFSRNSDANNPPHFLWNAKMRFGKTFATYQLAKKLNWKRVLVLTYKPAVEAAWREDLEGHADFADWKFKGKDDNAPDLTSKKSIVWFASFQDVIGQDEHGNPKSKNLGLYDVQWDAVVIDEYHFGAWRDAARSIYLGDKEHGLEGDKSEEAAIDTPDLDEDFVSNLESGLKLRVSNFLYLSGTPFRALTEGEFLEDQVFNWTYSDEQRAKKKWQSKDFNPYASLPQMHLLAYEMPDSLKEVALNNQAEFSLTEFFRVEKSEDGIFQFKHEAEVQKWLSLLCGQQINDLWSNVSSTNRPPLPYEDVNLLTALQHTVWYLPSVAACEAMKDLLEKPHNIFFRDYIVVVAAGNKAGMGEKALGPVKAAIGSIAQDSKTITLSCGKLMTGVTVPAWAGIFMLRELKSPESYFQAAFRVQSPWSYKYVNTEIGGEDEAVVKEHCYVIDFSPNRALRQIVDYATRLRAAAGNKSDDEAAINEFMEFLPVLSFTGYAMQHLHAGDVIDYLTKGISSSMLARRWNSPELITLDLKAMEALLEDGELLDSLERIEMFRNISDDLTALISSNKELKPKKISGEKLTSDEKRMKDEASKRRDGLKKKLQRFLTRIPAFMYLTDDREKAVFEIIMQDETELFEKVTSLSLKDFERLVKAGAFNESKMDDAVWKFRSFEEPSLTYTNSEGSSQIRGGWTTRRDEGFAKLIEFGTLKPGDVLTNQSEVDPQEAVVSDDFGLLVNGVRMETPSLAAESVGAPPSVDGWDYWHVSQGGSDFKTLRQLI